MSDSYSPRWAEHVVGVFELKVDDEGRPEKIVIEITCAKCGETQRVPCYQGAPRQKIAAYALNHVHGDPLAVSKRGNER